MSNFTDELDEGFVQQMFDVLVEVVTIDTIDLGCDFVLSASSPSDFDGSVHPFFRRNPAEKEQIILRCFLEAEIIEREPMINLPAPVRLRQRAPLRMRNGYNRHIGKLVVNRRQIGQVEPAV